MAAVGDRVVVESEKVGLKERRGVVVDVSGPMVRVRWDDGQETLLVPSSGSLRVEHQPGGASGN